MPSLRTVLVIVGLTIAFGGVAIMAANELTATAGRMNRRIGGLIRPESVRVALAQAGLESIPVPAWVSARIRLALPAAAIGLEMFCLPGLGPIRLFFGLHLIRDRV